MDYFSLSTNRKAALLLREGFFLASASYYAHRVHLYSYQQQYIEVWYSAITNQVEKIIPMSMPRLFKEYFKQRPK